MKTSYDCEIKTDFLMSLSGILLMYFDDRFGIFLLLLNVSFDNCALSSVVDMPMSLLLLKSVHVARRAFVPH